MCGLIGLATSVRNTDKDVRRDIIFEGLAMDAFRGWDSTGLAAVKFGKEKEDPTIYKKAVNGYDFVQLNTTGQMLSDAGDTTLFLGHNRAATRGSVRDATAHPFQSKHITLVHNGTISNAYEICKWEDCPVDVDSAKIAVAMARDGEKETLERCEGAYAFMWYNRDDQTLNIARNDRKPLFWAYEEKKNSMYWASEDSLLCHLLLRNGVDIDGDILWPEVHNWYKFKLDDLRGYKKIPFVPSQGRRHSGTSLKTVVSEVRSRQSLVDQIEELDEWDQLHAASIVEGAGSGETESIKTTEEGSGDEIDEIRESLSSARLKDFRRAGVPTSKKKMERASRELFKLGLTFEAPRVMKPETFIKYRNQKKLGIILGKLTKGSLAAQLHSVTEDQFKAYKAYGRIYVKCVNTRTIAKNLQGVIVIEHPAHKRNFELWGNANREAKEGKTAESIAHLNEEVVTQLEYFGPGGRLLSLERFKELTQSGCGNCDGFVNPGFHDRVAWIGTPPSPICHVCTKDSVTAGKLGINIPTDLPINKELH